MSKCQTPYCRNEAEKCKHCSTCRARASKRRNQVKYAYQTLKDNSKARCIYFGLTLQQFEQFCYKTDYLTGKGKKKESYSIDRINNLQGYVLSNIQTLSLSDNSRKGAKVLIYDWQTKHAWVIATKQPALQQMGGG